MITLHLRLLLFRRALQGLFPIDCGVAFLAASLGMTALFRPILITSQSHYTKLLNLVPYFGTIAVIGAVVVIAGSVGRSIFCRRVGAFVEMIPFLTMFLATPTFTGRLTWGFDSLFSFTLFAIL